MSRHRLSDVERLFALADQIEARLRQAQTQVARLTQSLLAQAFRGELVPTDAELARREGRQYETGAAMLERIREVRSSASRDGGGRRLSRRDGPAKAGTATAPRTGGA